MWSDHLAQLWTCTAVFTTKSCYFLCWAEQTAMEKSSKCQTTNLLQQLVFWGFSLDTAVTITTWINLQQVLKLSCLVNFGEFKGLLEGWRKPLCEFAIVPSFISFSFAFLCKHTTMYRVPSCMCSISCFLVTFHSCPPLPILPKTGPFCKWDLGSQRGF